MKGLNVLVAFLGGAAEAQPLVFYLLPKKEKTPAIRLRKFSAKREFV